MRDNFSSYHPAVIFAYFLSVIICGMFFVHPILLIISACGALSYSVYLGGGKVLMVNLCMLFFIIITGTAVNMLFNHRGMTTLFYLRGNPVTFESAVYGAAAGLMIGTMIMWFSCCNKILTGDKIMYLFGRVLPVFSLLFSMVLRFVPHFADKTRDISAGQRGIRGNVFKNAAEERDVIPIKDYEEHQSLGLKVKTEMRTASILTTWALENAVDTANSMKSRGYGLAGRTSFSFYRFDIRDGIAVLFLIILDMLLAVCSGRGAGYFSCFPMIKTAQTAMITVIFFAAYAVLVFIPLMIDVWEDIKWQYLQLKI